MPTTPAVWLATQTVNANLTDTQTHTQVVQLANGNFWVTWTDFNDTVDSDPGSDIMGQQFDVLGNPSAAWLR